MNMDKAPYHIHDLKTDFSMETLTYFTRWMRSTAKKHNAPGLEKFIGLDWVIAGGALRDYFMKEKVSDVDFFFKNQEAFDHAKHILDTGNVTSMWKNDNCIRYQVGELKIDLVRSIFGDPEDIIRQFDFTVCCVAIDKREFRASQFFFPDLAARHLRINNTPLPVGTMKRMVKYIKKGFTPCIGTMTELSKALVALPEDTDITQPFYFD